MAITRTFCSKAQWPSYVQALQGVGINKSVWMESLWRLILDWVLYRRVGCGVVETFDSLDSLVPEEEAGKQIPTDR